MGLHHKTLWRLSSDPEHGETTLLSKLSCHGNMVNKHPDPQPIHPPINHLNIYELLIEQSYHHP